MIARLTVWLASAALCLGLAHGAAAQELRTASVIELFTSQGCSSCPTADALLGQYASRPDVVALSLPVDYWDHLGWRDTLARPKFTARQRAYAEQRGDGRVYTPQAVVNGLIHAVGSSKDEIDRAIEKTGWKLRLVRMSVLAESDGETIRIETQPAPNMENATGGTIWVAVVQPTIEVEITRGENTGKKVTYTNVVRELNPVGAWSGKPTRIELKHSSVMPNPGQRCAVLLQEGSAGRIVGATWVIGPTN